MFSTRQKTIYIVLEARNIPPGTRLLSNWMREGSVIQVSNEMLTAQGYHNANLEFHINSGADGWQPGNYQVRIMTNGQPGPSAKFVIK